MLENNVLIFESQLGFVLTTFCKPLSIPGQEQLHHLTAAILSHIKEFTYVLGHDCRENIAV